MTQQSPYTAKKEFSNHTMPNSFAAVLPRFVVNFMSASQSQLNYTSAYATRTFKKILNENKQLLNKYNVDYNSKLSPLLISCQMRRQIPIINKIICVKVWVYDSRYLCSYWSEVFKIFNTTKKWQASHAYQVWRDSVEKLLSYQRKTQKTCFLTFDP